jgi:transcriptional regulator with XRE-family HTH domain
MRIAEAIQKLRVAYGETQAAFAKRVGLSAPSVAHFENGSRRPDPGSLVHLVRAALKGGHQDLADVLVRELPGVREDLLVPVWRAHLRPSPTAPETGFRDVDRETPHLSDERRIHAMRVKSLVARASPPVIPEEK